MKHSTRIGSFLLAAILMPGGSQALAQTGPPAAAARRDPPDYVARPVRVEEPPLLDGVLDDLCWRLAEPLVPFTQREPAEGEPATELTEVRLVYTQTALYLAFRCEDSEPEHLRARQLRWDGDFSGDDRIELIIDTFGTLRDAYAFRFTPLGAQWDAQIRDEGENINVAWDGVWLVRTRIEPWGWAAEVQIPFSTLRFDPEGEQRWTFNIERVIRRKNEFTYWTPVRRGLGAGSDVEGKYRLMYAGQLRGMEGIRPGSRLELKPYGLRGMNRVGGAGEGWNATGDVGLDARYMLAPNATADITFNTDFAQVEADQEQINLDRFPLFFPEKREFFLEGFDIFTFGVTEYNERPPFQLFYSRRIGLSESPRGDRFEVPIDAGLKITGTSGAYTVGALAVRTAATTYGGERPAYAVPGAMQGVFRLSRDILARSRVGLMWLGTDRGLGGGAYAAGGIDAALSLFRNTQITGFLAGSRKRDGAVAPAGSFNYEWNTDVYGVRTANLYIDADWSEDMGFVQRKGIWKNTLELTWKQRPERWNIRQTALFLDMDYYTRPSGRLERRRFGPGFWIFRENGDLLIAGGNITYEALDGPFSIGDVAVPAGFHRWAAGYVHVETDASRPIGTTATLSAGTYYQTRRRGLFTSLWARPGPRWTGELILLANRIRDGRQRFSGDVLATRLTWTPSVSLFTKLFAQLNTAADAGNVNFLVSWRYRPRSYVYLVYNGAFRKEGAGWIAGDRVLLTKIVYLWNL